MTTAVPLGLSSLTSAAVRPTTVVLEVSSTVYRRMWVCIFIVRCVSLLFLGAKAALYFFLAHPNMVYYASLLGPQAQPQLLPTGVCLLLLSAAHGYKAMCMLFYSWQYGEFVYEARSVDKIGSRSVYPVHVSHSTVLPPEGSQSRLSQRDLPRVRRCRHACVWLWGYVGGARLWGMLFGSHGFFGVKSEYFDIQFALRECAEIISQTLQLREASRLVVKHWVTNLYAGIVVVNCWSTPVVQYACRRKVVALDRTHQQIAAVLNASPRGKADRIERQLQGLLALERLLCVATSVILDLCTSIVIPMVLLWPHVRAFDLATYNFPCTLLYDDVRFVSLVNELQQVFAVNLVDAIAAFFPHWGNYTGCDSMKSLVTRRRSPRQSHRSRKDAVCQAPVRPGPRASATPSLLQMWETHTGGESDRGPETTLIPSIGNPWIRASSIRLVDRVRQLVKLNPVHVLFFLWGLVVLGLHTHAISRTLGHASSSQAPGCKQVLRPWLTSQTACSVYEFNCYMNQSSTVPGNVFADLDMSSLAVLILSHCSALVVPSTIREFPNLVGFEIYNSTIVHWNTSASFSTSTQHRLAYVILARTNMTRFPEGLTTELPPNLMDIEVSISNLSTVPNDLDVYWPSMAIVYFEYCALTSFPVVLSRIEIADLSLVGNRLTTLITPGIEDWSRVEFGTVGLGHNPLRQLPLMQMGDLKMLRSITIEATELETLPVWMIEAGQARQVKVYLKNSVFCLDQPEDVVAQQHGAGAYLTCVDEDPRGNGSVPIAFISSHRSVVRDFQTE